MADNRTPLAVTPVSDDVQEQIHYDTLWATAQDALSLYAGKRWTARGDADPGITLMQAFTYGVSDISYRHTLPLVDLLTHHHTPDTQIVTSLDHSKGIFAPEFGPEWALTSSPVTLEDYRRGLLDLTVIMDADKSHRFCFRDVQIAQLAPEESYQYAYNEKNYAFEFRSSEGKNATQYEKKVSEEAKKGLKDYSVSGGYRLWLTLNPGVTQDKANLELKPWLQAHRNLCEWEIQDVQFIDVERAEPKVSLTLNDDLPAGRIIQVIADALWEINQTLMPPTERRNAAVRLAAGEVAEQVYSGPNLKYGWAVRLPPERETNADKLNAYVVTSQSLSAAVLGNVSGVIRVQWEKDNHTVNDNMQLQFWLSPAPKPDTKDVTAPDVEKKLDPQFTTSVSIYKRGQNIQLTTTDVTAIQDAYGRHQAETCLATPDDTRSVPYGRYRNPGFYRSVGTTLPPVYGLQQGAEAFGKGGDKNAQNLLLFLRTFEQQLANSAHQLGMLPSLLGFDGRQPEGFVWGASYWPYVAEDPLTAEQSNALLPQKYHDTIGALVNVSLDQMQDPEKELAILDYLLGYFNETRAAGDILLKDQKDFIVIQQGFLRQVTRLAYDRAAISISKISALQRKIAARIGVGRTLFDEKWQRPVNGESPQSGNDEQQYPNTFPAETLPFYLVEHQELLPKMPGTVQDGTGGAKDDKGWFDVSRAGLVNEDHETQKAGKTVLKLNLKGKAPAVGQLIDIENAGAESADPFMGVVFYKTDSDNALYIDLDDNRRLRDSKNLFEDTKNTWKWRVSQTWLKPVVYKDFKLEKVKDDPKKADGDSKKTDGDSNKAVLTVKSAFPAGLKVNTQFALRPQGRWLFQPSTHDLQPDASNRDKPDIIVEVTKVDPILGTVEVEWKRNAQPVFLDGKGNVAATPEQRKGVKPVDLNSATGDQHFDWDKLDLSSSDSYAWSLPYDSENFAFTLSVVLDRTLLEHGNNPAELSQWIESIVREEMPSHLNLQMHWIKEFDDFAGQYLNWQNKGRPVGDQSYLLLKKLGIGERPVDERSGIGSSHVASDNEKTNAIEAVHGTEDLQQKRQILQSLAVIYVEPTPPPTKPPTPGVAKAQE